MLSIEEAHRRALTAVDEAVGWVPPKREAEHVERILAAHIAIRVYGLAVLESVEMYIIDDAVVEAARAQIKALS